MSSASQRVAAPLIKLIVFAVVTIVLTAALASTIASVGWGDRITYRAHFTDVTGLLPGDEVRIAGVRVGKVDDIRIVKRNTAEVEFSVDRAVRLATTTNAKVRYRNLVGQRYVALTEGAGGTEALGPDGLIPLAQTQPALDLTTLFNGFRPLFEALNPKDVNAFAYEIIQVLQGESGTVQSLLTRTASLTNSLADRDAVIGRVIDNLNSVLGTINARDAQLSGLIVQLQRLVSGLAGDRKAIGDSLQSISEVAEATEGLVRDARPALKADIAALSKVAGTLAASESIVEGVIQRLPTKLRTITRTASYGSWFNFYLCQLDGTVVLPVVGRQRLSTIGTTERRCS
jgi:phospholipid/cholesterol/gamma-HCH transport system substrate-binding protein